MDGLLKVQEVRAACQQGETSKFMMELRNEDFQDLTLEGEELLREEPRHGTRNSDYWDSGKKLLGVQTSFWTSINNNDQEGHGKSQAWAYCGCIRGPDWELADETGRV